ncbi:hypothetical protein ACOME3_002514 [Neoechinorhynchus agilis]
MPPSNHFKSLLRQTITKSPSQIRSKLNKEKHNILKKLSNVGKRKHAIWNENLHTNLMFQQRLFAYHNICKVGVPTRIIIDFIGEIILCFQFIALSLTTSRNMKLRIRSYFVLIPFRGRTKMYNQT